MAAILIAVLAGIVTWSFAEYALHCWVFHGLRGWGPSYQHLQHHAKPDWFAPAWAKALSATVFCAVVFPVTLLLTNLTVAITYTTAFVLTYFGYEVIHRRSHTHAPRNRYARWVRKNHLYHHFGHPLRNQGVTTPVWDIVFRTRDVPEVVRVPRRFAITASPWMLTADGQVKPELADDYVLVGAADNDESQQRLDHEAAFANVAPVG